MIVDHMQNKDHYLSPLLAPALHALASMTRDTPDGNYPIDDTCYINVMTITTKPLEETMMEIHRHHIDIHYVLQGQEVAEFANLENRAIENYIEANDIGFVEGEVTNRLVLEEGDFYITFENHPHKPSCCKTVPSTLKKAVAKIKVGV